MVIITSNGATIISSSRWCCSSSSLTCCRRTAGSLVSGLWKVAMFLNKKDCKKVPSRIRIMINKIKMSRTSPSKANADPTESGSAALAMWIKYYEPSANFWSQFADMKNNLTRLPWQLGNSFRNSLSLQRCCSPVHNAARMKILHSVQNLNTIAKLLKYCNLQ